MEALGLIAGIRIESFGRRVGLFSVAHTVVSSKTVVIRITEGEDLVGGVLRADLGVHRAVAVLTRVGGNVEERQMLVDCFQDPGGFRDQSGSELAESIPVEKKGVVEKEENCRQFFIL
jgi:hypothetical protein